ncbi:MAG: histidine kinase [Gemmatimonadota bacterium]
MPRSRASVVLAVLLIWTMVALLSSATSLLFSVPMEKPPSIGLTFGFQLASWAPWALITPFVFWLTRRFPIPQYLALHCAVSAVAALLHLAIVAAVGSWMFQDASANATWSYIFRMWLGSRLTISALTYWLITGVALAFNYYQRWRGQELRASALEAELARAELASLRMQLQPHFLFNALHAINVLIREDPSAAGRVVVQLGDLLRASLQGDLDQEVTLVEERGLIERYLAIESIRFEDRLRLELQFPPELDGARVPHFILQPLVENAFKHGLSQTTEPALLRLSARRQDDRLILEVSNDGPAIIRDPVHGLGLSATVRRLSHLYGAGAALELGPGPLGRGAMARITLPLAL